MKKLIVFGILLFVGILTFGQSLTDTLKLKEVEIISTYRANIKTPVSKTYIPMETIKECSAGQEVPVFLSSTPTVTAVSDGGHGTGYTYMRMRGIDQTRINFTLNGVPMNEPEDQGFYSSNFPDFLSSLNSIDIIRGVGMTSYGVASYAGSVNFESVNLRDSAYQLFTGTYGSFNTYKTSAELNTGLLKNNTAFYSRASIAGSEGYRYHSGNKGYSYFFSGGYFGTKHIVKTNAFIGNSANRMAWLGASQAELDSLGNRYNPNSASEWDNFTQSFVQLQDYYQISTKKALISTIYYNRLEGNWDLDIKNTFGDPTAGTINYQLWSNFTGAMVNYKYSDDVVRFTTGVNANYYDRTHAAADKSTPDNRYYLNKGVKNSASAYGKLEYDLKDLTVFTDIQYRYSNFSYIKDNIDTMSAGVPTQEWQFFSPKLGFSYKINDKLTTYISVGENMREPTRTDMFGAQDNMVYTDNTRINTNFMHINPEKVIDYELGIKSGYDILKGNLNIFYMDFNDEITLLGAVGANSLPLMTSVDNSFRSGAELNIKSTVGKFQFTNTSSYMYCEIQSDGRKFKPVLTPEWIFSQGAYYTYKFATLGASYSYIGSQYLDLENLNKIDANTGLNLSLTLKYKKCDLIINANNILSGPSGALDNNGGYIGPDGLPRYFVACPRNLFITLHIKL